MKKPETRNQNQTQNQTAKMRPIRSFGHWDLVRISGFWFLVLLLAGCASNDSSPTTRPALMSIPIEQSTSDYWFRQPNAASATSGDFDKLWEASADTVTFDQFEIEWQDRRHGMLETYPMISKQFFEVWRSDAGDANEVALNSLQTIRRTIRIDFSRNANGQYVAYPKVLKEQLSHPEKRITAQAQFSQAFNSTNEEPTRTTEQGNVVASRYWYSIGRDTEMEKELAQAISGKLGKKS
jgi:hypothetical protein